MKRVIFHPAANAEAEQAMGYYESSRLHLGAEFVEEVERATNHIQRHPAIGAPYKRSGFRHFVLDRFPYVLFYAELEDAIWIVAVAHGSRRPGYWLPRRFDQPE